MEASFCLQYMLLSDCDLVPAWVQIFNTRACRYKQRGC